jgi:hypothetical protein
MVVKRRSIGKQTSRGFALLGLLVILTMGTLFFYVDQLTPAMVESIRQKRTETALAMAKDALIGYVVRHREIQAAQDLDSDDSNDREMYGSLPLPDLGYNPNNTSEGNNNTGAAWEGGDAANFLGNGSNTTVIGRLPWRTLDIPPLRDGHGECLWYAVSGSHQRMKPNPILNWDTLAQLDIVTTNNPADAALKSLAATPYDRPVAIIFSPGPRLGAQNRDTDSKFSVTECGGNYTAANYLDPSLVASIDGTTDYYSGGSTADTSVKNIALSTRGKIQKPDTTTTLKQACATDESCSTTANDIGLPITSATLFDAIRKNGYFRQDINSMLDRMTNCLRDQFAAGGALTFAPNTDGLNFAAGVGRLPNSPASDCYGNNTNPLGYFDNYRELTFAAQGGFTVNGQSCAGVLVFASQRGNGQSRASTDDKKLLSNYLEGENLESMKDGGGTNFSGVDTFARASVIAAKTQAELDLLKTQAALDITRCIPTTTALTATTTPAIPVLGQLAIYSPNTRLLTLGKTVTTTVTAANARNLIGCAWSPETHPMGGGLRSYFSFKINDAGGSGNPLEGFTFAIVDGDNNSTATCGGSTQHLGYSGNNLTTPFIAPPKIAFEVDATRQAGFTPTSAGGGAAADPLRNGRQDPLYVGGHVAIVYWGGETAYASDPTPPCNLPHINVGGACYLPQEQDDNVHGRAANTRSNFPPPPANPVAPATAPDVPPDTPGGLYKLDPGLNSVPAGTDFHVRVELTRTAVSYDLPSVRVATTSTLTINSPGTTVDGVLLISGDRILVKDQTTPTQNGIYTWNSGTLPMTRSSDADSTTELAGAFVEVQQGTQNAHTIWRQTNPNATLGTDPIRWANARVKVATQANLNLSSPGVRIDTISMVAGDRVLVKAQTTASENGIYLWNTATSAMTRVSDADTAAELSGIAVQVQQGSDATAWYRYNGSVWSRLFVRVAAQSPITLSSPGATIDGVSLSSGDRVLLKAQSTATENGIYVWNGAASAMTRATDANSSTELAGALTHVVSGTDTGRTFHQTSLATTGTLETDLVQWTSIDPSPQFMLEIWILPEGPDTNKIAAMKNTTRPMGLLYSGFTPHLRDAPTIGYPFRNVRLGFTVGQNRNATDQTTIISNTFTTWID